MKPSNYDKFPFVAVPGADRACVTGWDAIASRLRDNITERSIRRITVVVECYPGVLETDVLRQLNMRLHADLALPAAEALLPPDKIDALVAPFLGGDDPVFGFLSDLELPRSFDPTKCQLLREKMARSDPGLTLIVGCGARYLAEPDLLVYADLARREAQLRFRRNEVSNLGAANRALAESLKYKRAYFVDWRVADRWKRPLIPQWDFLLDTHDAANPKLAEGEAVRRGLQHAVSRPFRVVPFFDSAPWGGQWMKQHFDLDSSVRNYGWCFDCVPEENSLLLGFGPARIELPSIDLVFDQPSALLGFDICARYGAEFPIRFDMLDTMGGGNLSFQVHPLASYIRDAFGMPYTQEESYYLLDAGKDASVYIGLCEDADAESMIAALRAAQSGGPPFPVDSFANRRPAKRHDHFLIPTGTVHCSGANSMVLEISATPYIFTFKLWDWDRMGLNGQPRPIHLDRGFANIQWGRKTKWVDRELINSSSRLAVARGGVKKLPGLHRSQFIETRRHWFTETVPHNTGGTVNVLNLVEGNEALVESPDGAFAPFTVHYAETFIVPAFVGPYTVRPAEEVGGNEFATVKARVRPNPAPQMIRDMVPCWSKIPNVTDTGGREPQHPADVGYD